MTKQKKIAAAIALIVVVAILIVSIFLMSGHTGGASSPVQDVAIEVLEPLSKEEGAALTGVCDRTLAPGAVDNLDVFIEKDDTIVKSVTIDASKVDFAKAGEYEATYEITLDKSALDAWLQENDRSVVFQQDSDPIILRTVATITIQEDATTTDQGKSDDKTTNKETSDSTTDKESNPSSNQSSGTSSNKNNGSSGTSSNKNNGSSGGSSSQSSHKHNWQPHEATRTVTKTVTVVDTPEQTVQGARFYTMTSDGRYIANGPTYWFENGFTQEDLKEVIKTGIKNADENGLYNGVDYRNYQNVSKTIPAVTHTEKQKVTETYVDYYYCSCGARKDA